MGSSVCTGIAGAVKVTQIFKQKLKIQHGCPLSSQGLYLNPQLQENRCSPGILTPESCYTASSSAANMNVCPLHSHLHKCGCVSLVSFLFHAGDKTLGWLQWSLLTHMPELWNLSLPPPSQSSSPPALGCAGPSLRLEGQFGSHCSLPHQPLRQKCRERTAKWKRSGRQEHTCLTGFAVTLLTHRPACCCWWCRAGFPPAKQTQICIQ